MNRCRRSGEIQTNATTYFQKYEKYENGATHAKQTDAKVGVREFERLNRAIRKANLQVPIAAEFPLEDAAKVHQRIEQGHVLGKIILRIA
jgi:NADPH:quinone reductase-like Zn-dependent oxidoreductase